MATSVSKKLGALMFRAMDKMRHRDAFDIGNPTGTDFTGFDKSRQILLVTFKRSGEAMPSPINHGVDAGKLYVRTDASTGKVKRIRNNPNVVVVPSSLRGKPEGQPVAAIARILPESDHAQAERAIAPTGARRCGSSSAVWTRGVRRPDSRSPISRSLRRVSLADLRRPRAPGRHPRS